MITVAEATKIVMDNRTDFGSETVSLLDCNGKILAEDVFADRNFPPFDRVMMDGVAIKFEEYQAGIRKYDIKGIQTAGIQRMTLEGSNSCLEVMTGAILPENTDTVVKFEDIIIENGAAKIGEAAVKRGQNIHVEGTDRKKNEILLLKGIQIGPAEIGVLSTVGKTEISVRKTPVVAIVSTGDELVDIDKVPLPYQIRKSNSFALRAQLVKDGIFPTIHHFVDEKEQLHNSMTLVLKECDIVILSGGVSRGRKDFVPDVLDELGVQKKFHRVSQRPGKPFWFGTNSTTTIFALPGNPVSTFMCFQRYVLPFIRLCMSGEASVFYAKLSESFEFIPELTYFLQVKLEYSENGEVSAFPIPGQGSGDLANLVDADAFMELPSDRSLFKRGEVYPILRF